MEIFYFASLDSPNSNLINWGTWKELMWYPELQDESDVNIKLGKLEYCCHFDAWSYVGCCIAFSEDFHAPASL